MIDNEIATLDIQADNGIETGWVTVHGEHVYPITHAKATKYNVDENGNDITVYDKIESIAGSTTVQIGDHTGDLNTYITQGIWYFNLVGQQYAANMPGTCVNGWLHVLAQPSSVYVKQIFYRLGTLNVNDFETFVRTYNMATKVWSGWTELVTRNTKVCASFNVRNKDFTFPVNTAHILQAPLASSSMNNGYFSTVSGKPGIRIEKAGTYLFSSRAIFEPQTKALYGYRAVSIGKKAVGASDYSRLSTGKELVWGKEGNQIQVNTGTVSRRFNVGDYMSSFLHYGNTSLTDALVVSPSYVDITYLGA